MFGSSGLFKVDVHVDLSPHRTEETLNWMCVLISTDPKSESRGSVLTLFYLPRDERFDQVKASDFAADALRSQQHRLLPTVKALGEMEQEFDNFADIKSLYAPEGKTTNGVSNLVPAATGSSKTNPNPKVPVEDPLAFVHEYAFPTGPDTSQITFPLPKVIEGACKTLNPKLSITNFSVQPSIEDCAM